MLRWSFDEPKDGEVRIFSLWIENGEYEARFDNCPKETYEQIMRETGGVLDWIQGARIHITSPARVEQLFENKKDWPVCEELITEWGFLKQPSK
jgi:hypothetical protein